MFRVILPSFMDKENLRILIKQRVCVHSDTVMDKILSTEVYLRTPRRDLPNSIKKIIKGFYWIFEVSIFFHNSHLCFLILYDLSLYSTEEQKICFQIKFTAKSNVIYVFLIIKKFKYVNSLLLISLNC